MINNKRPKIFWWIVSAFLLVPLIVSVISTIHVINFFELSNSRGLALTLAIAFELGALSALAGLIALDKINKNVVWLIFILLTAYQMMGNTYYAFDLISQKMVTNPDLIKNWTDLFGMDLEDGIVVKRIIAIISGAILPIVSLSFLDLSVDYIQKSMNIEPVKITNQEPVVETPVQPVSNSILEPISEPTVKPILEPITEPILEPIAESIQEPIIEPEVKTVDNEDVAQNDFEKFIQNKKKLVEGMREPNLELLNLFYNEGKIQKDDELLTYSELLNKIDMKRFSQKEINFFLTLCNYLEIFKLSGTHRIALKTYDEAIEVLTNYLTIGDENA